MELFEAIKTRVSIREFAEATVPEDVIPIESINAMKERADFLCGRSQKT